MEENLTRKQRRAIPLILLHHALKMKQMTEVNARIDVLERTVAENRGNDGGPGVLLHRLRWEGYA